MLTFRSLMATAAALPFLLAPALAQEAVPDFTDIDDDAMLVEPLGLSVDELEDMPVYGPSGEQIGEVEDILADSSGQIVGLAIESDGFLGLGSEDVVISLDQVEIAEDRVLTGLTEEQLEALPRWDD